MYNFSTCFNDLILSDKKIWFSSKPHYVKILSPPFVNEPRHWHPQPSLQPPLQSCRTSPWPSIMERHRWQSCTCWNSLKSNVLGKLHLKECLLCSWQLTTDRILVSPPMGLELESQLGLLLFPTCEASSLGRCLLLAHTQLPSIEFCPCPGKSGQYAACINATNGMCT